MKTCENCGVEVEEDLKRCPLCRARLDDGPEEEPEELGEEPPQQTVSNARFWLWEVVSLLSFVAALVIFASDFAFGFDIAWARYPLSAIAFLWASATVLIGLAKHPVWRLIAQTVVVAGFLFALQFLTESGDWFLPLGLPITVLTGVLGGGAVFAIRRLRLSALPAVAVVILAAGVLVVGIELFIKRFQGSEVLVSWSLVAFACALALFFLILWINKRMRERHSEYRKVFHL
jgi:hypothetical protein